MGPHRGGEIIWQLSGYGRFELLALQTENPPAPRQMESRLLEAFFKR
jgi:hypothetical protein